MDTGEKAFPPELPCSGRIDLSDPDDHDLHFCLCDHAG